MKLSKLYCSDHTFQELKFNKGLSIVFGDVVDNDAGLGTVQEHNLGKTSLVELIDFMLLKKVGDESYLIKFNHKFLNWVFFLEIELNDGTYLTIRRSPDMNSKISFKAHIAPDQNFATEVDWDYQDLNLYSQKEELDPKKILQDIYLKFDVQSQYSYRSFLCYLLRTQFDYVDVFKLNQFEGAELNWKPALFSLLGFDEALLVEKYQLEAEIKHLKKAASALTKTSDKEDGEKYKLRAAIEAKEEEKKVVQQSIESFNFYTEDNTANRELVEKIEREIALLNDNKYAISYDLDQVSLSLKDEHDPELDASDLKDFFEEINVNFSQDLKAEYAAVIKFSQQLSVERKKYLAQELKSLNDKLKNINKRLLQLNQERVELLKGLQEKDSFKKFKVYQARAAHLTNEIFDFKQQLRDIERNERMLEEKAVRLKKVEKLKEELALQLDNEPEAFKIIRKHFRDYYKEVFEYTATLFIKLNRNGNVVFEPLVLGNGEDMTGKSKGYTSIRVMCASFVLAVLATYSDRSYFRFAYHDGIMEGWGDNHKLSFIKLLREYCAQHDIQYVTSMIKSDMPPGFEFGEGEVIRILTKEDTLFNVDF